MGGENNFGSFITSKYLLLDRVSKSNGGLSRKDDKSFLVFGFIGVEERRRAMENHDGPMTLPYF